jgi:hypothetical protein
MLKFINNFVSKFKINFLQGFRKPIMMSFIPRSLNKDFNTGAIEKAEGVIFIF